MFSSCSSSMRKSFYGNYLWKVLLLLSFLVLCCRPFSRIPLRKVCLVLWEDRHLWEMRVREKGKRCIRRRKQMEFQCPKIFATTFFLFSCAFIFFLLVVSQWDSLLCLPNTCASEERVSSLGQVLSGEGSAWEEGEEKGFLCLCDIRCLFVCHAFYPWVEKIEVTLWFSRRRSIKRTVFLVRKLSEKERETSVLIQNLSCSWASLLSSHRHLIQFHSSSYINIHRHWVKGALSVSFSCICSLLQRRILFSLSHDDEVLLSCYILLQLCYRRDWSHMQ